MNRRNFVGRAVAAVGGLLGFGWLSKLFAREAFDDHVWVRQQGLWEGEFVGDLVRVTFDPPLPKGGYFSSHKKMVGSGIYNATPHNIKCQTLAIHTDKLPEGWGFADLRQAMLKSRLVTIVGKRYRVLPKFFGVPWEGDGQKWMRWVAKVEGV